MTAPPPPEEAAPALAGAQLLLRRVELGRGQLLGPRFVRYYALLDLLVVPADAVDLPGADHAVVQRVDHVEGVAAAEAHLALLRLLVVEVRPARPSQGQC